jgi:prepilin signal peptidase PulO-like enzyme (type II secretory pathway)
VLVAVGFLRFETLVALAVSVFIVALMTCAATDLLAFRVPDAITLPSILLALGLAGLHGAAVNALLAALLAATAFGSIVLLTRGGLGFGDVKLAALIGACLGLPAAAFALAAGILLGSTLVIGLYLTRRIASDQALPFAPALATAACTGLLLAGPAFG